MVEQNHGGKATPAIAGGFHDIDAVLGMAATAVMVVIGIICIVISVQEKKAYRHTGMD